MAVKSGFKLLLILLLMNQNYSQAQETEAENVLFVGTYTKKEGHVDGKAEGIYAVYQDRETGKLRKGKTAAVVTNPSFLKTTPDGKFLYAVSELTSKDASSGFIYSYKIKKDHSLEEIGKLSTEGFAPCHIALDNSGNFVFVSNYLGGIVSVFERDENGILAKKEVLKIGDQKNSHPHSVRFSPDNKHFYVADLGEDKISIFNFNAETGEIIPHSPGNISLKEGTGPRHLVFSADAEYLYSANELNNSVSVFKVNESGGLELLQNLSTLPDSFSGKNSVADIHFHPSGTFLYVSNRGHNSIVIYEVNKETGKLKMEDFVNTRGKTPRNFTFGPEGKFLYVANQDSDTVSIFEVDSVTGKLDTLREIFEVKTPVCLEFPAK